MSQLTIKNDSHDNGKPVCGIVMPISALDGCTEAHWTDVHKILTEAIESAGFDANVVSNADDVGIIQKRIIQNLYDNPVVVCDVSGKNPNVMFELGLRLAFNKPTIIVKDDKTSYSFDTAPIEHLDYPRDLRFTTIVEFKKRLVEKIKATYQTSISDPSYTTFLKHFGEFTVAKLDKKEISGHEYIVEELRSLSFAVRRLERVQISRPSMRKSPSAARMDVSSNTVDYCLNELSEVEIDHLNRIFKSHPSLSDISLRQYADHQHLTATLNSGIDGKELALQLFGRPPRVEKPD